MAKVIEERFLTQCLHKMFIAHNQLNRDAYDSAYHDLLQMADDLQMQIPEEDPKWKGKKKSAPDPAESEAFE